MGGFIINQAVVLSGDFSKYVTINSLFGAVVCLAIILLIMIITYYVNIKPNLNNNYSSVKVVDSSSNVFDQIAKSEEEELVNDSELVAVITAAIYASMGDAVPADGFVVRSIRKTNSKRWMNA